MKRSRQGDFVPVEGPATFIRPRVKRPIDKQLIAINKTDINAQTSTVLKTTTFPCTVVGLRWSLATFQSTGTGEATTHWAVVVVRDGNAASAMSTGDASDFYTPEQDVLTFGVVTHDNNTTPKVFEGSTKTMRKMMGGDQLLFIAAGTATNINSMRGVIQFFCKS
jgi:hypothetical protein